ncbi:unnamed protein product [Phytophthora fragariaefolia]|uniref:Unnamed protein product n=1 Tax=Phytophthora fragariaefolia TaxID=1490495 RepID=A0A9W7CUT4_9STRA|nr:unnamed protein product [Phytophthora fragariaefolia]
MCRHPGCSWKETLSHVLGYCPDTESAVRGRHDNALKLVINAIEATSRGRHDQAELLVDQTVPTHSGPALRPDLQLYNRTKRTVAIVDPAITYEDHRDDTAGSSAIARIAD